MEQNPVQTRVEPPCELRVHRAVPLELQMWVEPPLARSEFPVQRKPSIALALRHGAADPRVGATNERAPSHHVQAAILGIVGTFVGALAFGLLGRALEAVLLWCL
jgi:hypothetical protein